MSMSNEPQAEGTSQSSTTEQVVIIESSSGRQRRGARGGHGSSFAGTLAQRYRRLQTRAGAWRASRRTRRENKDARLIQQWSKWGRFRRWRRSRPFAGSILLILSGLLVLWGPAMLIRLAMLPGSTIWAGLLVGALLVVMGIIQLLAPTYSLITGAIGVVLALVSLVASTFGGFGIGMLLGIIGGALGVAWRPVASGKRTTVSRRPSLRTTGRP